MGGGTSINYCTPYSQKHEGESAIYRNPFTKDRLYSSPEEGLDTMKAVILNSAKVFSNRPAMGTIIRKGDQAEVQYLTYSQALERAHAIGSGIINKNLFSTPQGEQLRLVSLFSKNRVEWGLVDWACLLFGITTIPIYDTLGDENITYVFEHTSVETIFTNDTSLKSLTKCKNLVSIKNIVCFDPFTEEQAALFKARGADLISFQELEESGRKSLVDHATVLVKPEQCLTFSYTSGTTGPPKGAMISHRNFCSFLAAEKLNKDTCVNQEDTALSYLPLPHILEREFDYVLWGKGGRIIYFTGDVQKLKDDLSIAKPTVFLSVPRLFSRFYEVIKNKFEELQGWNKTAVEFALKTKLENLKKNGTYTHRFYDRFIFAKTREALGGRCRLMISGSAPLLPEVQHFLKVVLCAPLVEGYGQTESTGAILFSAGNDPEVRQVGGPVANFEIKLVDIPEMHYLSTDKDEQGRATPRGQIWARGPGVFMGYYHDKQKTEEAVTPDGWLKTGDVGAMTADTKAIKIVDRKKNIFKLQQGEYVAAEKVENIYMKCPIVAEVFLHGQSTQTFCIAVVVPHRAALLEIAKEKGIEGELPHIAQDKKVRFALVSALNKVGKQEGLMGFQQAKNVFIELQPFLAKGIVTNTMKIQRHEAKKTYREVIDQLYKEGMLQGEK